MARKRKDMRQSNTSSKDEVKVVNSPPGVKFYSLIDVVQTERILSEVESGNLVFLNISRISAFPERKTEFLKNLKKSSAMLHATLKMVSEETVMVAPSTVPIEIRSLSPEKISKDKIDKLKME
ncbi:MAG: cell division protein SepF [Candidatus Heimdallarchaeota archaeon]|nr:cell division protein SepF [Candidatus Heimdallarchaeota archaeon]MCK4876435.1 cell division protein SepF [Candidatus Heimdallarchaeota archaeon]